MIAALTGAHSVLIVTEPTVSGAHDLTRVLELANHFKIPAAICVNKWDIHPEQADRIEASALAAGATPVGRIRYDKAATTAQRQGRSVVEMGASPLADDIQSVWKNWIDTTSGIQKDAP